VLGNIYRVNGPLLVDPEWGYIITRRARLVQESMETNRESRKAPWQLGIPSLTAYLQATAGRGLESERYSEIFSLRHWWEWNYFHFFADVLGKLSLLNTAGIDLSSVPLLLGPYIEDVSFARQALSIGRLAKMNWIVPQGYVRADMAYYCRTYETFYNKLSFALDLMEVDERPGGERRLFLNRRTAPTRRIINQDEVAELLGVHGFEEVNTDAMRLADQIGLFSQAAVVVAVHGAGLTNILFRRSSPLTVLELTGDRYGHDNAYAEICSQFGHKWGRLVGKSEPTGIAKHADFSIDIAALKRLIARVDL
jgi:capsular polysaccharide biosynthesis protein